MFNVGSVQGYLKLNTAGWTSSMRGAAAAVTTLSRTFAKMGAVALGSLFLIEREFGKFDKAIRHATSVSETTSEQFQRMSEMALDASVRWNKAASNTAQAFYFLGSAGLSVTEQLDAFNDTIMLSRAMGSELSQTVEGMVDIVRAFGLEFANTREIADQLTKTIISSNQQFYTLSRALTYASSTARLTNNTLAETTAMLGVMANAGIKGSMAGTVLRRAMTNLMSPTGDMAGLIYELGLNIYDTTGRMKPFINIMGEIGDKLQGTTDEYKNMVFEVLFGRRAIAGQIVLFNYGSQALRKYANEIENAGGTTERVAGKQMKAFTEQLGRLWKEMQRISIIVGGTLAPSIERLGNAIRSRLRAFREYVKVNSAVIGVTLKWTAALSAMLIIGGPLLLIIASLTTKMVGLAAVIVNPWILLIASLYTLRAVWKQTSEDIIQRAAKTARAVAFEKIGGGGIALGAAAAGAAGGALIGGPLGAGAGGLFGLGLGILEARKSKQVFQDFLKRGKEASIDFGAIWSESLEAIKKQMKADFGDTLDFANNKINNTEGIVGKLLKGFRDYLGEVKGLYDVFITEPDARFVKLLDRLEEFGNKLRKEQAALSRFNDTVSVTARRTGYLAGEWSKALKMVFSPPAGTGKTWVDAFTTVLDDIQSAWADTMQDMIEKGGGWKDFMENMFMGILNSFNRMIAEIAAADLLYALTGGKGTRLAGTPTLADIVRGIFTKPTAEFGLKVPSLNPTGGTGLGMFPGGADKMAVTINVDNKGIPVNLRETGRRMDGRQLIISTVMEELDTNPNFRDRLRG